MYDYSILPNRIVLCVDLRSFYASVSCIKMGLDPLHTKLAVVGDVNRSGSIVLAATPPLKALGVKKMARLYEIPRHKDILVVNPIMGTYIKCSNYITKLALQYVPIEDFHQYSIDEFFMDITRGSIFTALHDIDITIFEGEFVGIMGPSGSRKSTLLNILSTIDVPTTGEIIMDGTNIIKMTEEQLTAFRRDTLGFIFQDYNLLDTLTIKDNILLPLALRNINAQEIDTRVDEITTIFGIQELLNKYPYQISGGQKQRAVAARAIIGKPKLILADEPTGALDSQSANNLLHSLQMLNTTQLSTILLVTHDPFVASHCKRVLFIKDGKIFTELVKGEMPQESFFQKLLHILSALGGGEVDANMVATMKMCSFSLPSIIYVNNMRN